jgi:hypothetical protein
MSCSHKIPRVVIVLGVVVLSLSIYCAVTLFPVGSAERSPDDAVYLIKALSCGSHGPTMQSGFSISTTPGIYTALHGVAGCSDIQAELGQTIINSLILSEADVKDDIALLTSPQLEGGVGLGISSSWKNSQHVNLIGHPLGIELLTTGMSLRTPAARPLRGILSSDVLKALSDRKSPDPSITVLSTDGVILPGDSGSPILDDANDVLGVADGGLSGGTAGINWAIPFRNITLVPAAGNAALDRIAQLDPSQLFSLNANVSPRFPIKSEQQDGESQLGVGHFMDTELTLSRSGSLDAIINIKNTAWLSSFCGKFAFWFYDNDQNVVWHGGLTDDDQWCVYARATLWRQSQLRRTWHSQIPPKELDKIRSFAILQTTGEKQPFAWLKDNLAMARDMRKVAPVQ